VQQGFAVLQKPYNRAALERALRAAQNALSVQTEPTSEHAVG
jgi:hypothetical protein